MTAEQILSTDFLTSLSGAIDRYYDSEAGSFHEGYEHFHNASGQATLVKAAANELGLPCDIYGIDELPEGTLHPEGPGAGYDWALVGGRWIVDLWRLSYHGSGPVVYDLSDPAQAAQAERTFGPQNDWEKLAEDPKETELATRIWNEFTGPYRAVDDLLGGVTERQCARLEAGSLGNTSGGSSPSPSAILDILLDG